MFLWRNQAAKGTANESIIAFSITLLNRQQRPIIPVTRKIRLHDTPSRRDFANTLKNIPQRLQILQYSVIIRKLTTRPVKPVAS